MFEGLFQPMHLLVLFIICMLVFGPKKVADLGKGLGDGIREFKDAIKDKPAAVSTRQTESASGEKSSDA